MQQLVSMQVAMTGLSERLLEVIELPGRFARARKSALGSVGWYIMTALANHVEYGPPGWKQLHALTRMYWKKRGMGKGNWVRRRSAPPSPAAWLGKFARYRVSDTGSIVQIDFGKGKRNKNPGRLDPQLSAIARRIDSGERIPVTAKMRKKLAATYYRAARAKSDPEAGVDYFPLRKSTTEIVIPRRPIFTPVFNKVRGEVGALFERKFWASFYRIPEEMR